MLEENLNNTASEEEDDIVSGSGKSQSVTMSKKELILVNSSKLLIEFLGTCLLAFWYLLLADN